MLYLIIFSAVFIVTKLIVERINRNMMEDYDSMLTNSEKSDAKDRKKNTYIFFKKNI